MKKTICSAVAGRLGVFVGWLALLGGCGPAPAKGSAASSSSAAVAPPAAAGVASRPAPAAGGSLVECSPGEFAASVLTGSSPIAVLESWPLDGSDPAPGSSKENPVLRCGARDSYAFVAGVFRCPDGTNPLNGDSAAGGAARRGNVGPNSQRHIIDLYEVPCAGEPERVYVDMYGCPDQPKREATPEGLRINDDLPAGVEKLMREALDLSSDEKFVEAVAKIKEALAQFETGDRSHPNRGRLLDLLGSLQQEAELPVEAEQSLAAAYRVWNSAGWPPIALSGNTCVRLAKLYAARKQTTLATCVAQRGIAYLEDVKGQFDGRIIASLYLLGELYQAQGQPELAERMLRRGVRLTELSHGRRHPLVTAGLSKLEAFFVQRGDNASVEALRRRSQPRSVNSNKI